MLRLPFLAALGLLVGRAFGLAPTSESTARLLPVAADAYAASSANVVAGLQNTLFTDGHTQFAAFYRADGAVVLGRRDLGQDYWETHVTALRGDPADAHRTLALTVDGQGFIHLVWNQHGDALRYVKSLARHSFEFGPRQAMVGTREEQVTYPAFLRDRAGNLYFFYRDGRSGRGDLVLNRYELARGTWSRVQENLVSGEGQRSAYAQLFLDDKDTLHLAWVWRDSPDVATNHDLAYAKSKDGGKTWESVTGQSLSLPLTFASADYALRIPTGHNLMNPPSLAADNQSRPLIVNYWSETPSGIPQLRLVRHDGKAWQVETITERKTPFSLAGTATKRPPLSRALVVSRHAWRKPFGAVVVYRDDEYEGRAMLALTRDLSEQPVRWTRFPLTETGLDAWEPSFDPEQWRRLGQLQMLVQAVEQRDGNDGRVDNSKESPLGTLIWSPFIFGHAEDRARKAAPPLPLPAAGVLERNIDPELTLATLQKAVTWQFNADYKRDPRGWEIAPFYIGALEVAALAPDAGIEKELTARFEKLAWAPAPRDYHADDYCIVQAYAELYRKTGDKAQLAPSLALFQRLLAKPATTPLDWNALGCLDRWSWCDALFMAPPSWLDAYWATGNRAHLEFMNREFWLSTETLYHPADGFYARDESYLDLREPNGRRLYWSRGNGWVAAGLARILARFPRDHVDYPRYVALYQRMMEAVLDAQQPDGLWRPGLLDGPAHPAREVSGSSFYTFALAWGINHGLLERARFEPAVRRAWNHLLSCVREDGKVEYIQPIGAAPEGFDPTHTDAFGVGAFLLAGSETYRLVTNQPAPLLSK